MGYPTITKIEIHSYEYEMVDVGFDESGFNLVYELGSKLPSTGHILRLFTDTGPIGECVAGKSSELSTIQT